MPTPTHYSGSGPRVTVNSFIKDPLLIRARMVQLFEQQFIMESILRKVVGAEAGVVEYEESTPLFTDDDAYVIAEGGEIPLTMGQDGVPKAAFTIKTGLGIEITKETRTRHRVDKLNQRMIQVRNTIVRHWERRLFNAFAAAVPVANTIDLGPSAATRSWYTGSAPTIRDDILNARLLVTEAEVPNQDDSFLGFNPDTILISTRTFNALLKDDEFAKIYNNSPLVNRSPTYTGELEKDIYGLTWMVSRFMTDDDAYLMERKTVGGYSDEYPMETSPTYEIRERQCHRADCTRRTAIFVDQPLAIARIKNIKDA
jgi:hypothetical protein